MVVGCKWDSLCEICGVRLCVCVCGGGMRGVKGGEKGGILIEFVPEFGKQRYEYANARETCVLINIPIHGLWNIGTAF